MPLPLVESTNPRRLLQDMVQAGYGLRGEFGLWRWLPPNLARFSFPDTRLRTTFAQLFRERIKWRFLLPEWNELQPSGILMAIAVAMPCLTSSLQLVPPCSTLGKRYWLPSTIALGRSRAEVLKPSFPCPLASCSSKEGPSCPPTGQICFISSGNHPASIQSLMLLLTRWG